jgi:hypothetical protein
VHEVLLAQVEEEKEGEAGQHVDRRRLRSMTHREGYFSLVRRTPLSANSLLFRLGINRRAKVAVGIRGINRRGLVGLRVTYGDHPIHEEIGSLQGLAPFKPNEA